jgi:hypothetical protein
MVGFKTQESCNYMEHSPHFSSSSLVPFYHCCSIIYFSCVCCIYYSFYCESFGSVPGVCLQQALQVDHEKAQERVPHLHDEAKEIPSFRFMGLAVEKGETILFVLLTRSADAHDISHTLQVLMRAADDIEQPSPLWMNCR